MDKSMSDVSFKLMSFGFKFRDIFKPRKNILEDAGIKPGFHVLDFGCGPGGYIMPLAKMIGDSGKIYALDINPQAIQSVRVLAVKNGLTNVETTTSDGATSLPDASLDAVLLYDVLHHLNKPGDVLEELHRVLKPEGFLSMSDHHLTEEEIISRMTGSGHFKLLRKGKKVYNFSKVN
ncbi:MAG: class I SAM-dependent methyltransferase [Dehalococcoidales bacterium]|nr:class I SAM-dependent methyltransferase [Dehalococcoidales bacterium]